MNAFTEVAKTDELADGTMKKVHVEGREILLAKVENTYYAAENRCPHLGGDLSQGTLFRTVITCPLHHSQFDLKYGRVIRWTDLSGIKLSMAKMFKPPKPLKTYEVKVEGNRVLVALE